MTEPEQKIIRLVYIGPTIPYERIRTSQILTGTEQEINSFMAPVFEKFPEARFLLVSPENLPEALRRRDSKNTITHKYFEDMMAKYLDNKR